MDACSLSPPTLGCLYTMVAVAVVVNVAHILAVKPPKKASNSTDVLQWSRTGVVLVVLTIVLPLQTSFSGDGEGFTEHGGGLSTLALASLSDQLLVDVYPLGLLATAVTRFRVCLCRGNADVLVTKTSAILTLVALFLPLIISVTVIYLSTHYEHPLVQHCLNTTESANESPAPWLSLVMIVVFDIVPIVLTFVMYGLIHWQYRKSENNVQRRQQNAGRQRKMTIVQMTRRNGRSICRSVFLLVVTIMLTWVPYVALKLGFRLETFHFDKRAEHAVCLFIIVTLYLVSPIAEGLFLRQKRENLSEFVKQIGAVIRSRFEVTPAADESEQQTTGRSPPAVFIIEQDLSIPQHTMLQDMVSGISEVCVDPLPVTKGPKRWRVCFSSDLDYDDVVSLRRLSTYSRASRHMTRRRRKLTGDRRLRKVTGPDVATIYKSDTQTDEQTDDCLNEINVDQRKLSGRPLRVRTREPDMENEFFTPEVVKCPCFQDHCGPTDVSHSHAYLSPLMTSRKDKQSPILQRWQHDFVQGPLLSPKLKKYENRESSPSYSSDVFSFDTSATGKHSRPMSAVHLEQPADLQSTKLFLSMPELNSTNVIVETQQDSQSAKVYVRSPDVTATNISVHVDFNGTKVESKVRVGEKVAKSDLKQANANQKVAKSDQKEATADQRMEQN